MFSTSQEEAPSRLVKPDALNALYSFPLLQIQQLLTQNNTHIFHTPLKFSIDNNYSIMSVHSSSSILLLLLLCLLSMHACSSRPLSNKHSAGKLHSIKVGKVERMFYSTTFDASKEKEVKVIKHHEGSDASTTDQETKENTSSKDLKFSTTEVEAKKKMSNPAGGVAQRDQSLVSVSFRVPRKKQGDHHLPGFSLDYSPPKTHPPSHN